MKEKKSLLLLSVLSIVFSEASYATQNKDINLESYFPAPSGYYQNMNVGNQLNVATLLDATNQTHDAIIKTDIIRFTNHPLITNSACLPSEEFNAKLSGSNLNICWKNPIYGTGGTPPPIIGYNYRWTPAPFSNWTYDTTENSVFTLPLAYGDPLPGVGVGTGSKVRGALEVRHKPKPLENQYFNYTTILLSNDLNDQVWALTETSSIDDPATQAVEPSTSSFSIFKANWPLGIPTPSVMAEDEVLKITYNRHFGFNSPGAPHLYSFDKLADTPTNDKMWLAGLDLVFDYQPGSTPVSGSFDTWKITNESPPDLSNPNLRRPVNDVLNFVGMSGSLETSALSLLQDKVTNETRVGIGTPLPGASLHVAGFGVRSIFVHNGFDNQDIGRISFRSGATAANPNGNEKSFIYVKDGGNIGINTTTPSETLSVLGNITLGGTASDYALSTPYQLAQTKKVGMREVVGQINVSNAGSVVSVLGNDYGVQHQPLGVYRIRFSTPFASSEIFTTVTLVAPSVPIVPANFPITPVVQTVSNSQIIVTLVGPTGSPVDYSFCFHTIGTRK